MKYLFLITELLIIGTILMSLPACRRGLFSFNFVSFTKSSQKQYRVSNPVISDLQGLSLSGLPAQSGIIPNTSLDNKEFSEITILFGGDVMLGRYVNVLSNDTKDYTWMFKDIATFLNQADVTMVNLESPLVKNCPLVSSGMKFCANEKGVTSLKYAGIDIVNLANNHILNYGQIGFSNTKELLLKNDIFFTGDGYIFHKIIKGIKFAFLGFNDIEGIGKGIFYADENLVKKLTLEAKQNSDVVIVSFHYGNEYTKTISNRQKELSYLAIDSGADIVIGHHPHWVQMVELYKGKPIFYSLGNLVFDQMWSENTRLGALAKVKFKGKTYENYELFETKIYDYGRVVLLK